MLTPSNRADRVLPDSGDHAVGRFLDEAEDIRDADAATPEQRALHAHRVEDGELVRDVILPGGRGERGGGVLGVALVHADHHELVREIERVDGAVRPEADLAVDAAGGEEQQREALAAHLVIDAGAIGARDVGHRTSGDNLRSSDGN